MTGTNLRKLQGRESVKKQRRLLVQGKKEILTIQEAVKGHGHVSRVSDARLVPLLRILGVLYWGS